MLRWFRGVLAGFFGWFDLRGRIEDLEADLDRLRRSVEELELHWTDQVDKLTRLNQRANKRLQDGTAAIAEQAPTVTEVRAQRAARKLEIRQRRTSGLPGA